MMSKLLQKAGSAKAALGRSLRLRRLPRLDARDDEQPFPPADSALTEPNGLLAYGGSLTPRRLEQAYRQGIFPYFQSDQPIQWWSPDPRAVLFPERIKVSTTLKRRIRQTTYSVSFNRRFREVVLACAAPRAKASGTWITRDIVDAYCQLHELGRAHSMEVWRGEELVGGLYGVSLGAAFFGESMFSRASDASKVGFVYQARQLGAWGFHFIDCQFPTPHLERMGISSLPRAEYLRRLQHAMAQPDHERWQFDPDFDPLAAPALPRAG